jgi:hypothetical protein
MKIFCKLIFFDDFTLFLLSVTIFLGVTTAREVYFGV